MLNTSASKMSLQYLTHKYWPQNIMIDYPVATLPMSYMCNVCIDNDNQEFLNCKEADTYEDMLLFEASRQFTNACTHLILNKSENDIFSFILISAAMTNYETIPKPSHLSLHFSTNQIIQEEYTSMVVTVDIKDNNALVKKMIKFRYLVVPNNQVESQETQCLRRLLNL